MKYDAQNILLTLTNELRLTIRSVITVLNHKVGVRLGAGFHLDSNTTSLLSFASILCLRLSEYECLQEMRVIHILISYKAYTLYNLTL